MNPTAVGKLVAKPISSLKLNPLRTVPTTASVAEAVAQLQESRSGLIGIQDPQKHLIGVLTERDIISRIFLSTKPLTELSLASVITPRCLTIKHNASVARAVHTMGAEKVRHLVVTAPDGPKTLSTLDLVNYIYKAITKALTENDTPSRENSKLMMLLKSPVHTLAPVAPLTTLFTDSIRAVAHIMNERRTGSVLLTNKIGALEGIFTERDLLKRVVLSPVNPYTTTVDSVMTRNPQVVLSSASVAHAFNIIQEGGYRHLPILDHSEKLCGLLSVKHFMNSLSEGILADLAT